jgi:hypothetical protein
MNITIRLAKETDLAEYTKLLQKTYQDTYTNNILGLTKDLFSEEIFNTLDTQKYLATNLEINDKQKCWLAFDGSNLIGSIVITEDKNCYELRGLVKKLWHLALNFSKNKNVILDIYAHNTKT